MEDEEIEKKVLAYLKKKGFLQIELALQEERGRLSSSSHPDVPRFESFRKPFIFFLDFFYFYFLITYAKHL